MSRFKKVTIALSVIALSGILSACYINSDKILSVFQPTNQAACIEQDNVAQTMQEQQETPKVESETEQEIQETENDTKEQEKSKKENDKPKTENNIKTDKQSAPQSQSKPKQEKKTVKKSETVYITETGECYHKSCCKHLRQSKIAIDKKEAQKQYRPCKDCRP